MVNHGNGERQRGSGNFDRTMLSDVQPRSRRARSRSRSSSRSRDEQSTALAVVGSGTVAVPASGLQGLGEATLGSQVGRLGHANKSDLGAFSRIVEFLIKRPQVDLPVYRTVTDLSQNIALKNAAVVIHKLQGVCGESAPPRPQGVTALISACGKYLDDTSSRTLVSFFSDEYSQQEQGTGLLYWRAKAVKFSFLERLSSLELLEVRKSLLKAWKADNEELMGFLEKTKHALSDLIAHARELHEKNTGGNKEADLGKWFILSEGQSLLDYMLKNPPKDLSDATRWLGRGKKGQDALVEVEQEHRIKFLNNLPKDGSASASFKALEKKREKQIAEVGKWNRGKKDNNWEKKGGYQKVETGPTTSGIVPLHDGTTLDYLDRLVRHGKKEHRVPVRSELPSNFIALRLALLSVDTLTDARKAAAKALLHANTSDPVMMYQAQEVAHALCNSSHLHIKGDKGDQGTQGEKGDHKGSKGDTGDKGEGEKGDKGTDGAHGHKEYGIVKTKYGNTYILNKGDNGDVRPADERKVGKAFMDLLKGGRFNHPDGIRELADAYNVLYKYVPPTFRDSSFLQNPAFIAYNRDMKGKKAQRKGSKYPHLFKKGVYAKRNEGRKEADALIKAVGRPPLDEIEEALKKATHHAKVIGSGTSQADIQRAKQVLDELVSYGTARENALASLHISSANAPTTLNDMHDVLRNVRQQYDTQKTELMENAEKKRDNLVGESEAFANNLIEESKGAELTKENKRKIKRNYKENGARAQEIMTMAVKHANKSDETVKKLPAAARVIMKDVIPFIGSLAALPPVAKYYSNIKAESGIRTYIHTGIGGSNIIEALRMYHHPDVPAEDLSLKDVKETKVPVTKAEASFLIKLLQDLSTESERVSTVIHGIRRAVNEAWSEEVRYGELDRFDGTPDSSPNPINILEGKDLRLVGGLSLIVSACNFFMDIVARYRVQMHRATPDAFIGTKLQNRSDHQKARDAVERIAGLGLCTDKQEFAYFKGCIGHRLCWNTEQKRCETPNLLPTETEPARKLVDAIQELETIERNCLQRNMEDIPLLVRKHKRVVDALCYRIEVALGDVQDERGSHLEDSHGVPLWHYTRSFRKMDETTRSHVLKYVAEPQLRALQAMLGCLTDFNAYFTPVCISVGLVKQEHFKRTDTFVVTRYDEIWVGREANVWTPPALQAAITDAVAMRGGSESLGAPKMIMDNPNSQASGTRLENQLRDTVRNIRVQLKNANLFESNQRQIPLLPRYIQLSCRVAGYIEEAIDVLKEGHKKIQNLRTTCMDNIKSSTDNSEDQQRNLIYFEYWMDQQWHLLDSLQSMESIVVALMKEAKVLQAEVDLAITSSALATLHMDDHARSKWKKLYNLVDVDVDLNTSVYDRYVAKYPYSRIARDYWKRNKDKEKYQLKLLPPLTFLVYWQTTQYQRDLIQVLQNKDKKILEMVAISAVIGAQAVLAGLQTDLMIRTLEGVGKNTQNPLLISALQYFRTVPEDKWPLAYGQGKIRIEKCRKMSCDMYEIDYGTLETTRKPLCFTDDEDGQLNANLAYKYKKAQLRYHPDMEQQILRKHRENRKGKPLDEKEKKLENLLQRNRHYWETLMECKTTFADHLNEITCRDEGDKKHPLCVGVSDVLNRAKLNKQQKKKRPKPEPNERKIRYAEKGIGLWRYPSLLPKEKERPCPEEDEPEESSSPRGNRSDRRSKEKSENSSEADYGRDQGRGDETSSASREL